METLEDATINICRLKGEALGMQCMISAILSTLPAAQFELTMRAFREELEVARVVMLNSEQVGEQVVHGFETFAQQMTTRFPSSEPF